MRNFHCCASCRHFEIKKTSTQTIRRCSRLGFDTMAHYQFNCWDPKDNVKKLMKKWDEQRKGRQ